MQNSVAHKPLKFTFHYGSTYTKDLAAPSLDKGHLHSTMVLLILRAVS